MVLVHQSFHVSVTWLFDLSSLVGVVLLSHSAVISSVYSILNYWILMKIFTFECKMQNVHLNVLWKVFLYSELHCIGLIIIALLLSVVVSCLRNQRQIQTWLKAIVCLTLLFTFPNVFILGMVIGRLQPTKKWMSLKH